MNSPAKIALDADTQEVIRNMRGFHCQIVYGDWTREAAYAAKKVGIEVQRLAKAARSRGPWLCAIQYS